MKLKVTMLSLVAGVLSIASAFACDLTDLMRGNTSLAREIKKLERQGYVVVEGDMTYYSQYRYFMEPTAPYVDGSGQVTMRRSAGNYSLTTEYITISFEADVKTNNQCATTIIDETYNVVY